MNNTSIKHRLSNINRTNKWSGFNNFAAHEACNLISWTHIGRMLDAHRMHDGRTSDARWTHIGCMLDALFTCKVYVTEIKAPLLKNATRSVARKVGDHFPEIEEAIALGIPITEIIEDLGQKGVVVTFINFKSILRRLRSKKRKGEIPKQMKANATNSQDGYTISKPTAPAVKTVAHLSGTSTKSNPTENNVGSALVGQVKEGTIVADTWRERRKQIVDF